MTSRGGSTLGGDVAASMERVTRFLGEWVAASDDEIRELVRYQLLPRFSADHARTVCACHHAAEGPYRDDELCRIAAAVELFDNYATILEDVSDRRRRRRGRLALHCRHGRLPAIMVSGYCCFSASELIAHDPFAVALFADLGQRLAGAEWRAAGSRAGRLGVEAWRRAAAEDGAARIQACARIATREDALAGFASALGLLRQGCHEVAETRLLLGHAEGAQEDPRRVLRGSLVAAVAADVVDADPFGDPEDRAADVLLAALPRAEALLDELAAAASAEAARAVGEPDPLLELVLDARRSSTHAVESRKSS